MEPTNQDIINKLEVLDKKIEPIIEAYDSVLLGKRFIVGIAGFVMVVAAFGGVILWLAGVIKHYFI